MADGNNTSGEWWPTHTAGSVRLDQAGYYPSHNQGYISFGNDPNYSTGCPYCGNIHAGTCPRVKAIDYYENGTTKRVEFHEVRPVPMGGYNVPDHELERSPRDV